MKKDFKATVKFDSAPGSTSKSLKGVFEMEDMSAVVTVKETTTPGTYEADKTFAELLKMAPAVKAVLATASGYLVLPLSEVVTGAGEEHTGGAIKFTHSETASASTVVTSVSIGADDTVTVSEVVENASAVVTVSETETPGTYEADMTFDELFGMAPYVKAVLVTATGYLTLQLSEVVTGTGESHTGGAVKFAHSVSTSTSTVMTSASIAADGTVTVATATHSKA